MKRISVQDISPGTVVDADWYSDRQELLVSAGTTISERHLELLHRRNIKEVFLDTHEADDELQSLLSMKFEKLDDIDFLLETLSSPKIKGLENIQKGEHGLRQLNESPLTLELDKILNSGTANDLPVGPALNERATELTAGERTDDYKKDIEQSYQRALRQVHAILKTLAAGARIEGAEIADMVKRFVDIFVVDRNILLNISGTKSPAGNYLCHHSLNVCLLSINIAAAYGYSERQIIEIGMGALLHDLGMLLVPREILVKEDRLTQEEWYEVQKHPVFGLHILEKIQRLPESVAYVAYQTHERENRTGYPKQRGGRLIHNFAKIVQVADIYESLSSPRPYRAAYNQYDSMERIIKMTRAGLISGEFVKAFLRYSSLFPVGCIVELSDRSIAKVVRANRDSYAKPVVSVLIDSSGTFVPKRKISEKNLSTEINLYILRVLRFDHSGQFSIMDGF